MTNVSSLGASPLMRLTLQRLQNELGRSQIEASSGRLADVGVAIGFQVSSSVNFRQILAANAAYADANAALGARLGATDNVLKTLSGAAAKTRNDIIGVMNTDDYQKAIASAQGAFGEAMSALNTSYSGQYLFSGVKTDVKPVVGDLNSGPAKTAIDTAFTAAFGVAPGSSGAAAITPAAMKSFLDTQFAALFQSPNWNANWSNASDTQLSADVAPDQRVSASATANEAGPRNLIAGLAMMTNLGIGALSADTRKIVLESASAALSSASTGVIATQARLGLVQRDATSAAQSLETQSKYLQTQIGRLEDIDPAEVATRISQLSTQLETAYTLTSRLTKLSLVNFL